ncbi:choline BCCT transporter BetT [Helcobacillus massiliensis]|uniref:choline BCCT transporter BetT n=1 Tax=Helcobacillus TaxID=1161125 RepID=UPI001EF6E440|nr:MULTISPECIES: choline BCCT transporter BetT [Helcobacillus]MCG7426090.1 choline BCCT transporter BetT [Helcobacillus sp. ACRRO]MCT1558664.1 choline BCCT transporter BetT [Helcobacillus massiliensis]MCT2037236.1 choline BCCT transporter BetT [Helcobacillus massiliensis]MCT2332886.1 choline BCCT transporter BetT [Helcobacillus massiliensis]
MRSTDPEDHDAAVPPENDPHVIERESYGGTRRSPEREARLARRDAERPPRDQEELQHRGPTDLAESGPRLNRLVFGVSSAVILAFSLWAIFLPDNAQNTMAAIVDWIAENVGWFYVLTVTVVIGFVIKVAVSKEGSVRIGPDHSRPEYKLFTWVAMLFAAGVGIDMLFYSVTGPITQYVEPVNEAPRSLEALREAVVWTMFHYGIVGWSMYSLLGMAMGYFAYRWGMPLSIRAALYPLFGKRIRGVAGDVIDIFALVGTVMGVATSMGIGVVLLSTGIATLIPGLSDGIGLQVSLVIVAVVLTVAATRSGVDKGIRIVSELNLWSAGAMMLYILVFGHTSFLLNGFVENVGRFLWTTPQRLMQTMVYEDGGSAWMGKWTLFFWAFWLAWGPFVGLFLARISRGRTLREFVIAAITVPVLCDFVIVSLFGNSAIFEVLSGNEKFAQLAMEFPERGWYALLEMFPGATILIILATISGLLFYLTSANSGAMVMSNFSSSIPDPSEDGAKWLRVLWSLLTALLTCAMLLAGGVTTMEYATLIFALPVTIIAWLVMASFSKALAMERAAREGGALPRTPRSSAPGGREPERSWRQRLASMRAYPSKQTVRKFVDSTVEPALDEVAAEFRRHGLTAELATATGSTAGSVDPAAVTSRTLVVTMQDDRSFHYQVAAVQRPVPTFGGRQSQEEHYYRLEVFTQTGSEGYDVYGLSTQQIIDDVLDHYEGHLMFLQHASATEASTVLTPPADGAAAV